MLGLLVWNLFFAGNVSVNVKAPDQIAAGADFVVEITINKGNINSFSRIQHDLPIGLTATEGTSSNAMFSFKDQKVKFMWLQGGMPKEESFVVTYKVHVDQTVQGSIDIAGQFIYLENNERVIIEIPAKRIMITGGAVSDNANNNVNYDTSSSNNTTNQQNTDSSKASTNTNLANYDTSPNSDENVTNKQSSDSNKTNDNLANNNLNSDNSSNKNADLANQQDASSNKTNTNNVAKNNTNTTNTNTTNTTNNNTNTANTTATNNSKQVKAKKEIAITCIRNRKYNIESNEIIVSLTVRKGDKNKFAKIQETIPEGYNAVGIENQSAIFTFSEDIVKFMWMNLPIEPEFTISYKLTPIDGFNSTKLPLKGSFSYVENEKTFEFDIIEKNPKSVTIPLSITAQNNIKKANKNKALANKNADKNNLDETTNSNNTIDNNNLTAENSSKSNKKQNKKNSKSNKVNKNNNIQDNSNITADNSNNINQSNISNITSVPNPKPGIMYRVQIAAGHSKINTNSYFSKYKLEDKVLVENHEGWRKYTVGTFNEYKQARDHRVKIWETTPATDAFVAAYNNGARITVQEALMVANQKWYK